MLKTNQILKESYNSKRIDKMVFIMRELMLMEYGDMLLLINSFLLIQMEKSHLHIVMMIPKQSHG